MKNIKYIQLFLIVMIVVLLTSCVTNKPRFSDISLPDNNARQSVSDPYFIKKTNSLGYLSTVGLVGGGAATGYFFPFIGVNKNEGVTDKSKIYSAVTAGVIGAGVGFLTNTIIFGHGKKVDINENKKKRTFDFWVKGYNKKYRKKQTKLIAYKDNHFTLIPENGYKQYVFYNIDDVEGYIATFPDKPNLKKILDRSVDNLNRSECKQVVDLFGEEYRVNKYRIRYITLSETYKDLVTANSLYPNLVDNIDELAVNKIQNAKDALDFYDRFPTTTYRQEAALKSYTTYAYPSEQKEMNAKFDNLYNDITQNYLINNATDIQKENYFKTQLDSKNITELGQLTVAIDNIKWINFTNRSEVILDRFYQIADRKYTDGDVIILLLKELPKLNFNITQLEANKYIEDILKREVEINVHVLSVNFKKNTSPDIDRFRKAQCAPFMVVNKGDVIYLVYGELVNNSKYTLPLMLTAQSKFIIQSEGLGSFIKQLVIGGKNWTQYPDIVNNFYCGYIEKNKKVSYAIRQTVDAENEKAYDFGPKWTPFSIQYVERVKLSDHKVIPSFTNNIPSASMLQMQTEWLMDMYRDLPNTNATDVLRGISYAESQENLNIETKEVNKVWKEAIADALKASKNSQSNNEDKKTVKLSKEEENAKCEEEAIKSYKNTSIKERGKWNQVFGFNNNKYQDVSFNDEISGSIYLYEADGKKENYKYALSPGIGYEEYENEEDVLKALYILKKCGFFTENGKKR